MKNTEKAFLWITEIIEKLVIPYQISGGFAGRAYGVERELADIDVEVADVEIQKIFQEVKPYVTFGPARYIDKNWDLELMTLMYQGQEIDIAGAGAKIYNQNTKAWELLKTNFKVSQIMEIFGKKVPVISKENLIAYKSKLLREVDREDISMLNLL